MSGDLTMVGSTSTKRAQWHQGYDMLKLTDGTKLVFGNGAQYASTDSDAKIYWDTGNGGRFIIDSDTDLKIDSGVQVVGNMTISGTVDGVDVGTAYSTLNTAVASLNGVSVVAYAALPKVGGAMTGPITTTSTFDGVNISARDAILTSTTTTANAALPKAGGTMTGDITFNSTQAEGNSGLVPAAGSAGTFLKHDGTFGQVNETGTVSTGLWDSNRKFSTPSSAFENIDILHAGTSTSGMTPGKIYQLKSDGWYLAQADDEDNCKGLLAVAVAATTADGLAIKGSMTLSSDIQGNEVAGSILYLSPSSGGVATITPPSDTGEIVRIIGYALKGTNEERVWFDPDKTYIEIV